MTGTKRLNQFIIQDPIFYRHMNKSKLQLKFKLHRNPSYLIVSAYLPSFSVMAMSVLPLFLNDEVHFATTITLVLTAQLCLYTLIQSSISDIPKTAYLKNIDCWNLFVTTVSLTNFFTLFLWEILQPKPIQKQIKNIMKIVIPLITLIGVVIYWITAGILYWMIHV